MNGPRYPDGTAYIGGDQLDASHLRFRLRETLPFTPPATDWKPMNPIREIRQRTGLTQEAFAKHMQVTRTALTRMEGRAKPARILVLAAERVEQIAPESPTRVILP